MPTKNLQELVSETAERFASKVALDWNGAMIRYSELESRSNRIANSLKTAGFGAGSIIALMIEDRIRLIEAIVGVLKAGCAFAPLGVAEPPARLEAMIDVIQPALYLAEPHLLARLPQTGPASPIRVLALGGTEHAPTTAEIAFIPLVDSSERPLYQAAPDDVCYIYFTSGSTGVPKAIAGRFKSLLHFIQWEIETLGVDDRFNVTQLANATFDASLRDIFTPLCSGATICIPEDRSVMLEPRRLMDWLDAKDITLMHCVPAVFRLLTKETLDSNRLRSLRFIMMAGETLFSAEITRWFAAYGDRIQLINLYGATENTMAKFCHWITEADARRKTIPIGKPMPGARAVLLDEAGNVCDPGVVGEIYIRTPYLTLGYYNNPELTGKVFIPNPLSKNPSDIVYKTGDYGRLLPDGNYELIGRKDHQVKIRGQRADLSEIEHCLKLQAPVHDCVVTVWGDDPDDLRLAAYLVPQSGATTNAESLRVILQAHLPEHLIPSSFNILDALPLTPNGKVDRAALPPPASPKTDAAVQFVEPSGELEEHLASIWREMLRIDRVGVNDNFFQLGGHSLLATQVISRIREAYQVDVPLRRVFERPTIAELASSITEIKASQAEQTQNEVLDLIEQMSEEEMAAMMEQLSSRRSISTPDARV